MNLLQSLTAEAATAKEKKSLTAKTTKARGTTIESTPREEREDERIANTSTLGRRGRPVRGPHPRDIIS
jgi:hypothetical protein